MKNQSGYINIPGWFFYLAPIGVILIAVELVRLFIWLYQNIEVTIK